jgi:hypothetical protein
MVRPFRVMLIAVCCLVPIGLLMLGRLGRRCEVAQGPATQRSFGECRGCHESVWAEWAVSPHARAWSSDEVQAAFRHFGHDRQCESCHAPQPVLQSGLSSSVVLRPDDRASGVNCATCHARPDGRVASRRTRLDVPCQPLATPELSESTHCGVCHTAIHKDWLASHYREEGRTCQDCHLPSLPNRAAGRSHRCLGGHDPDTVRSGALLTCSQEGQELVVAVRNHATGHNYPGERHNRVLLLQVIEREADGTIALAEQRTIKDITPFRGESSAEEVRAGETFTARFPVVRPPVAADVRLLYKAFPWLADRDALIVHQQTVALKGT